MKTILAISGIAGVATAGAAWFMEVPEHRPNPGALVVIAIFWPLALCVLAQGRAS